MKWHRKKKIWSISHFNRKFSRGKNVVEYPKHMGTPREAELAYRYLTCLADDINEVEFKGV